MAKYIHVYPYIYIFHYIPLLVGPVTFVLPTGANGNIHLILIGFLNRINIGLPSSWIMVIPSHPQQK